MENQVYTISQAAKAVGESTSVLRYWEDVLEIRVNRNPRDIDATPDMIFSCF